MSRTRFDDRVFVYTPIGAATFAGIGLIALIFGIATANPYAYMVAGTLLFMAIVGLVSGLRDAKYAAMPLAVPASYPAAVAGPRSTSNEVIKRPKGYAILTIIFGVSICIFGVFLSTASIGAMIFADTFGAILVGCGIAAGPVARFVVTPTHFHIDTARQSVRVPRSRIKEFTQMKTEVRLVLTNGRNVDFRVDPVIVDLLDKTGDRRNSKTQVRVIAKIVNAMERVPTAEELNPDIIVERPTRPVTIFLTVSGALFVLTILASAAIAVV
jgi:hypothetical protein